ncbi:MAG: hypothetical protein JW910_06920 [Anaerolineae bacterium]|nr:hypothetical protein [Anaerolineae bacterium]
MDDYEYDDAEPEAYLPEKRKRAPDSGRKSGPVRWWLYGCGCLFLCCACWTLPVLALGVGGVTLAAILDNSKVTASGSETVALDPDQPVSLDVTNHAGKVVIQAGDPDEIVVDYTKTAYAFSRGAASDQLNQIAVAVAQRDDGTVAVTVDQQGSSTFFFQGDTVDLTITVPPELALRVTHEAGKVEIGGVRVTALDVNNNAGDVVFDGALVGSGPFALSLDVGDMTVRLPPDTFVDLDAQTEVGEVSVSGFEAADSSTGGDGIGATWRGTLGAGEGTPPVFTLRLNVGEIAVQRR